MTHLKIPLNIPISFSVTNVTIFCDYKGMSVLVLNPHSVLRVLRRRKETIRVSTRL